MMVMMMMDEDGTVLTKYSQFLVTARGMPHSEVGFAGKLFKT